MVRVDKAFIAANAVDLKEGLTTPNLIEASTKSKMIEAAKQVILLADHTKFNKVAFARFAKLEEIDICVTDDKVAAETIAEMKNKGVKVFNIKA